MKTYTFHVSGTHCASCKILIEEVLNGQAGVEKAEVDLKNETVRVEGEFAISEVELAELFTSKIKEYGYTLTIEKNTPVSGDTDVLWKALPLGLVLLALFFFLQKSGILNVGLGGEATPVTSFIIGLIASVSSCLAIVGGLVLSISAKISEDNVSDTLGRSQTGEAKTFALFHAGRLVSFALLGGVLGVLGQAIGINFTFTAILGLLASIIMLLLGLNLVGVFKKNKITLPSGIFNFFRRIEYKTLTPLLVGFGTFFLPCGFTQSMQVVALSTGSFFSGAVIMFAFALGTLPMLALLSFGAGGFAHGRHAPLFFKTAGVFVVGLGIFALLAGLAGLGVIPPLFNI